MPSVAQPHEEPKAPDKGVKAEKSASPAEDTEVLETKEEEVTVDESDVEELEKQKAIPYSRFKEKNEEAKRLKAQVSDLEKQYKSEIQRLVTEREALSQMRTQKNEEVIFEVDDGGNKEVQSLKETIQALTAKLDKVVDETSESRVQNQISKLQGQYPEADVLAVLGWKKQRPDMDLDEAMELSHNRNVERVQTGIKNLIEKKKAKRQQALPSREFGFKFKDGEKPKTVREASSMMKKLLSGF